MKLNNLEKSIRKDRIKYFGENLILRSYDRVTIAAIPTGPGRAHVAWSIHSLNDGKNHRKYGEWVALDRLRYGQYLPIEFCNEDDLLDMLHIISEYVQNN